MPGVLAAQLACAHMHAALALAELLKLSDKVPLWQGAALYGIHAWAHTHHVWLLHGCSV